MKQRELEEKHKELTAELVRRMETDDRPSTITSLKRHLRMTQEAICNLEFDAKTNRNSVYLSQALEAAPASDEASARETQHAFPFVALGDGKAMIKPTANITALSAIYDKPPNPAQNPITFCSYLQKVCRYHQLTGADYRFILEQCLKDTPEQEILEEVRGLDPRFDAPGDNGYAWQDQQHVKTMIKDLKAYLSSDT